MTSESIGIWTARWLEAHGIHHQYLPIAESTSALAHEEAFTAPPVMVYVTDFQSAGRGRGERVWVSPPQGDALMATWSLALSFAPQHLSAPIVGLHVYRAVREAWPQLKWSLKPPNDIYLKAGKAGGLLLESLTRGADHRLLIGFGLNVRQAPGGVESATAIEGPDSLPTRPVSESEWQEFLHVLHHNLLQAVTSVGSAVLDTHLRGELDAAIKIHPEAGKEFVGVTEQGDLVYKQGTVSWHNI